MLNTKIYILSAPYYRKKPQKLLQPCSVANTDLHCIRIYMALRVRIRDPYPNKPNRALQKGTKKFNFEELSGGLDILEIGVFFRGLRENI